MGIEHLHPQHERLVGRVLLEPADRRADGLGGEVVVLGLEVLRVHHVRPHAPVVVRVPQFRRHVLLGLELLARPAQVRVALLAADPLPGVEAHVEVHVRGEVVVDVADQPAPEAVGAEDLGQVDLPGRMRNPGRARQHRLARVIHAAARDRGQAVGEGVLEDHALPGQLVQARRLGPGRAVGPRVIQAEGVGDHDHQVQAVGLGLAPDRLHGLVADLAFVEFLLVGGDLDLLSLQEAVPGNGAAPNDYFVNFRSKDRQD